MSTTNEGLLKEIIKLRAEVDRLSQICQLQRTELLKSAKKAHEVVASEAEKSAKSIAAEEAIKSLIAHLKDVAEKLPSGIYDQNGSHIPQENGLESSIFCASPVAPFESWATLESPEWVEEYREGVYITLMDF